MNKLVLDRTQMKYLQNLGLDISNSTMYWLRIIRTDTNEIEHDWYLGLTKEVPQPVLTIIERKLEVIPAFTLQDILELLPDSIYPKYEHQILDLSIEKFEKDWTVSYKNLVYSKSFDGDQLIDVAYKMLCWCIENNYGELIKK